MPWTNKYKKSIDCDNPKGFSQRAHCQGRKKRMEEAVKITALEKFRKAAAEREKKHNELEKQMKARHASGKEDMKGAIDRLEKQVKEDAPVNNAGDGKVAGIGVGQQGEPGVKKMTKKKIIPFNIFARKAPK